MMASPSWSSPLSCVAEPPAGASSPCAACKLLRRKCQPKCIFAPYFPPDDPHKFANVHKVFGASNVAKLLKDLNPFQREDAVSSLAYEAEMRLRDPVYGCVGIISILQHQLRELRIDLTNAKMELARFQVVATDNINASVERINLLGENIHNHNTVVRNYCDAGWFVNGASSSNLNVGITEQCVPRCSKRAPTRWE